MKTLLFLALAVSPAVAEETRQVDAHEHGVGQLDIAFDDKQIAIELHAPGADIVGFEYAAESSEDRAAVDAAVAKLAVPLDLFVLPAVAKCSVVQASAALESEDAHEEDHSNHDKEHKDEHADHADHEKHEDESGHTEFHAEYLLTCAEPAAVSEIKFAYFDVFPNALELEVQVVSNTGANAFEVERDNPMLDLRGMF
ncbi:DUF2796 domain-containing protein [Amylibacter sp. SFDW26]|uniref:DUF2796 domain-containing protein n=1 Tax=Amylibacter sp. SFDW26 TaxID=2652722 RepID=UPI00126169A9|nr:DUF2796 domain-containing protein [Amylibacter sp. SFDW26]KAB7614276.1 DUF2796 domain-containing protein [Amylibacter sp. SFDW26]